MSNQNKNIAIGTIIGAAVGLGAGLLFAPASGKKTREKIGQKSQDAKESLMNLADQALDSIQKVASSIKQDTDENFDLAKREAQDLKNNVASELAHH